MLSPEGEKVSLGKVSQGQMTYDTVLIHTEWNKDSRNNYPVYTWSGYDPVETILE